MEGKSMIEDESVSVNKVSHVKHNGTGPRFKSTGEKQTILLLGNVLLVVIAIIYAQIPGALQGREPVDSAKRWVTLSLVKINHRDRNGEKKM